MEAHEGKVRYAVIGAGHIARAAVLPAFRHADETCELVALVSSNVEKRLELAERYGIEHTGSYEELEDVLRRSQAEAVYITVPNTVHREYTERAARCGVHVLCEKPMATTETDCQAMIAAADENDVRLMVAYRLHFEAANLRAIEVARSGRIGDPRVITSAFSQSVPPGDIRWRADAGGGALFDIGTYCVNAARYLFRDEPTAVVGFDMRGHGEHPHDVDEATSAVLYFTDGRLATFAVNQAASAVDSYRVVGTTGDLRVEPAYDYEKALEHHLTVGDIKRRRRFARRDQFAAELLYFSRCILEDFEPEPDGWEGLADVRVMTAIQRSARTGAKIELAPFSRTRRPDMKQNIAVALVEKAQPIHPPSLGLH